MNDSPQPPLLALCDRPPSPLQVRLLRDFIVTISTDNSRLMGSLWVFDVSTEYASNDSSDHGAYPE